MTDNKSVTESPITWATQDVAHNAFIRLSKSDNVGVALRPIDAGEAVDTVTAVDEISKGHKIALTDIADGDRVIKYAQTIGYAIGDIACGSHIHTHNLEFRNTEHDYEFSVHLKHTPVLPEADRATFQGYRRKNGKVGTRNYLAIISSVNCSATVARHIAANFSSEQLSAYGDVDGVVAFTHSTGCGLADSGEGYDNLQRVIRGFAIHPNIAGVLMVGLGCEVNQIQDLVDNYGLKRGPLFRTMNIQSTA